MIRRKKKVGITKNDVKELFRSVSVIKDIRIAKHLVFVYIDMNRGGFELIDNSVVGGSLIYSVSSLSGNNIICLSLNVKKIKAIKKGGLK